MRRIDLTALVALLSCFVIGDPSIAQEAGLPSVPDLVRQLDSDDKFERRDAAMFLAEHGPAAAEAVPALIEALDDREQQVWFHAVTALSRIGPAAQEAIPRLMRDLGRYSERGANPKWYRSAHALGMIGPAALAPLTEALGHNNEDVRAGAAASLGWMGPAAAETTTTLIKLLDDKNEFVREKAAETLSLIGKTVLPAVTEILDSDSSDARLGAIRVAFQMGPAAAELAPRLRVLAQTDSQARVQAMAIDALPRIGVTGEEYAALLFELLHHDSEEVRHAVKNGLLSLPPRYSVQRLIHILETEDDERSAQAADLLGRIGPDAAEAVIPLINAVHGDRPDDVDAVFRKALVEIGPVAMPALLRTVEVTPTEAITVDHWVVDCLREMGLGVLSELNETLGHRDANIRLCSILALQGIGKPAAASESLLLALFEDPVSRVRAAAIPAAVAIAKQPDRLLDRVALLLNDDDPSVRRAATVAVGSVGVDAASLVPTLTAMLDDPDLEVRAGAVRALGGIGRRAQSAGQGIVPLLDSDHLELKLAAARALGQIGEVEPSAIAKLGALAADADTAIKEAALVSLGQMGAAAQSTLPVLIPPLSDPNDRVRVAAVIAYGRIEESEERLLPILSTALEDGSPEIRHAAARRISQLGDAGTAATPKLILMLANSEDQTVALEALESLPADLEHLPLYVDALNHRDYIVRGFSCEALGRLGDDAKEALPVLREARRDRNDFVRRRARRAIERIEGEG